MNNSMTTLREEENNKKNATPGLKVEPALKASSFLYDEKVVLSFLDKYVQIPFAGSNLHYLEKKMNGGLVGGKLYVLGVVPSLDRAVLLNNIADNLCLSGYPVLFFTFDDDRLELLAKTLVRFSQYEIDAFYDGTFREPEALRKLFEIPSIKKILNLKYVVDEVVYLEDWDEIIDQIGSRHGRFPVIFIDYLRKVKSKGEFLEERIRVDDLVFRLINLGKRFRVPILAVSELARNAYKMWPNFTLASSKESGSIEYEASWLGILAEKEQGVEGKVSDKNGKRNLELLILKANKGVGLMGTVYLELDERKMVIRAIG